jgi:uncharacterized protein YraI
MKRVRSWILVFAVMAMLLPMAVAFAQSGSGSLINASRVNARSGPGTGFPTVIVLDAGAIFTLLGRNADASWVQIGVAGGAQVWVNARFVAPSVAISSLPVSVSGTGASARVTAFFLNVRTGPAAAFPSLGTLRQGDGVSLLGRNADSTWVEIVLPVGTRGWVSTAFIDSNIAISALPITDGTGGGENPAPIPGPTGTVTAFYLNVRFGPSHTFGAFTRLEQGQVISLVGRNAAQTWLQISIPGGGTGWVNANYIRPSINPATLAVTG